MTKRLTISERILNLSPLVSEISSRDKKLLGALWDSKEDRRFSPSQAKPIPDDLPLSLAEFKRLTNEHPTLVICPITTTPWLWVYRNDCGECRGHYRCVKDLKN